MSYLSWNCRGIGSPRTARVLKDLIKVHQPSFVFLMETLTFSNKIEELRVKFGFDYCFSVDRVGRSGGLTILWKSSLSCEVISYSSNHIDVVFSVNNVQDWRLSCFYGYLERARRRDSWHLLRHLASLSTLPWCVFGDFNDILYASDKKGNIPHPQHLHTGFFNTIEDCNLLELELNGGKFTWERSRGTEAWVRGVLTELLVLRIGGLSFRYAISK